MFKPWYQHERKQTVAVLRLFTTNRMHTRSNGVDTTAQTITTLQEYLVELRSLRRTYGHL